MTTTFAKVTSVYWRTIHCLKPDLKPPGLTSFIVMVLYMRWAWIVCRASPNWYCTTGDFTNLMTSLEWCQLWVLFFESSDGFVRSSSASSPPSASRLRQSSQRSMTSPRRCQCWKTCVALGSTNSRLPAGSALFCRQCRLPWLSSVWSMPAWRRKICAVWPRPIMPQRYAFSVWTRTTFTPLSTSLSNWFRDWRRSLSCRCETVGWPAMMPRA